MTLILTKYPERSCQLEMDARQSEYIGQLYLEMFDKMMTYARSSLQSESLAEEAVQETFRIACEKLENICNRNFDTKFFS